MCRTGGRRCHGTSASRAAARERKRRSRARRRAAEAAQPANPNTATASTGGDVTTQKPQANGRHEVEYHNEPGHPNQNDDTPVWTATNLPGLHTPPPINTTTTTTDSTPDTTNTKERTEGDVTPTPTDGTQTSGPRVTNWAASGAQVELQSTGHVIGQTVVSGSAPGDLPDRGRDIAARARRAAENARKSAATGDVTNGPAQGVVGIQAPHIHNSHVYRNDTGSDR
jgi:hypothetical protein